MNVGAPAVPASTAALNGPCPLPCQYSSFNLPGIKVCAASATLTQNAAIIAKVVIRFISPIVLKKMSLFFWNLELCVFLSRGPFQCQPHFHVIIFQFFEFDLDWHFSADTVDFHRAKPPPVRPRPPRFPSLLTELSWSIAFLRASGFGAG